MTEFVSVRDVVFGHRNGLAEMTSTGESIIKHRAQPKPVDIARVVSAIEVSETYYYDYFGRFCVADDEAKSNIKQVLAKYHTLKLFDDYGELEWPSHKLTSIAGDYCSLEAIQQWVSFGWPEDKLPDFEGCHEQWKEKNGMAGKPIPLVQSPSSRSHVWALAGKLLEITIGKKAYEAVLRGNYGLAMQALQKHGLGANESTKRTLRNNLSEIVGKAPL